MCLIAVAISSTVRAEHVEKITVAYSNGGSNWPLFLAKEAGYYRKYGFEVNLAFAVHPAGVAMLESGEAQAVYYALDQILQFAAKGGAVSLISSPMNRGAFALVSRKEIGSVPELKGKRLGIGLLGDAPYTYTASLLRKYGLSVKDVEWVPLGPNVSARVAALVAGKVDAAFLTAPAYFTVQSTPMLKVLVDFADRADIFASTVLALSKKSGQSYPVIASSLLKAHAEASKRFYDDKQFAVTSFLLYNKDVKRSDVEHLYDLYAGSHAFERVPYVLTEAVEATVNQQADPVIARQMKAFDFHRVIDNEVVDDLAKDGFFRSIFGPEVEPEQVRRAHMAYRR